MSARLRSTRPLPSLLVSVAMLFAASSAEAGRCVGVFFRGFNAPVGTSGMDNLEAHLQGAFGGDPVRPFSTAVFAWPEQQQAFDFIDGFADVDCLVVAGHSFGGNAAIELATDFLEPAGIAVDLLVQFDTVGVTTVLPGNVAQGFNYYQMRTGFFEPEGEPDVIGSTNVYVEQDYGVTDFDITHTEIDCPLFERSPAAYAALFGSQPDLYERIEGEVAPLFVVTPIPALGPLGLGALAVGLLAGAWRLRSRSR